MKSLLIAVVMFLFGLISGFLITPFYQEFSQSMYVEEEYSAQRVKNLLSGFGLKLPQDAADVDMFLVQDGMDKQIWLKFSISKEGKDAFLQDVALNAKNGNFNREVAVPKMIDGTPITWWTFRPTFESHEYKDLFIAYDDILRTVYVYAVSEPRQSSGI